MNMIIMKTLCSGLTIVLALALMPWAGMDASAAEQLKLGIVRLNKALNSSSAGQRSKKILLAAKSQKESELKAQEQELKQLQKDLESNIMLSDEAKAKRRNELRQRQRELRTAVQKAQRELQTQERELTKSVLAELKTIVEAISKEDGFDLVFEQAASQVILYSRFKMIDITDKVISRYNKIR
jgi:Skp family chaperone for outer membrane proteins